MAKIETIVPGFTGVRAGVQFSNGVGYCSEPWKLGWFKQHGYIISDEPKKPIDIIHGDELEFIENASVDELKEFLKEHGQGSKIRNVKKREKLVEMAKEVI